MSIIRRHNPLDRTQERELERRIIATNSTNSDYYPSIRTLNFEGKSDFFLIWDTIRLDKQLSKNIEYKNLTFCNGKSKAIEMHLDALDLGFKISTLVDMDHDLEDMEISKKIILDNGKEQYES